MIKQKKRTYFLLVLVLGVSLFLTCSAGEIPGSARSLALGGVKASLVGPGLESVMLANPAGLSQAKSGIILHYNNRFGFNDYTDENLSLVWSAPKIGLSFTHEKSSTTFREMWQGSENENYWGNKHIGIGFGAKLKQLSFGLNLWRREEIVTLEEDSAWLGSLQTGIGADLGFFYPRGRWGAGFVYRNCALAGSLGADPQYNFGLRYGEDKSLVAYGDFDLISNAFGDFELTSLYGVEAWLSPQLAIRIGLDSAKMITAGLGINKGRLQVDYAYRTHPMGISHYLTTGFSF